MRAAEACPLGLDSVPKNPAAAMIARRRQRLDRAFKAVERVRLAVHDDVECLVIVVTAGFALWHGNAPIKLRAARVGAAKGHPRRGTRRPLSAGLHAKSVPPDSAFIGEREKRCKGRGAF